jgi:hypothetical protein
MLVDVLLGLQEVGTAGKLGAEPVGFAGGLEHGGGNIACFRGFST